MREITTRLRLNNIREEDQGRYQCVVANTYGRQLSMTGVVIIYLVSVACLVHRYYKGDSRRTQLISSICVGMCGAVDKAIDS